MGYDMLRVGKMAQLGKALVTEASSSERDPGHPHKNAGSDGMCTCNPRTGEMGGKRRIVQKLAGLLV